MTYNKMTPRYAQAQTIPLERRLEEGTAILWCTICRRALDLKEVVDGESVRKSRGTPTFGGYWHRGLFGHRVEPRHSGTAETEEGNRDERD